MELPKALENVLGALLNDHCVSSWKVTAEGRNPTVVLRLQAVHEIQNGRVYDTQVYTRKTPKQVNRDKQRMTLFKQRLETKNAILSDAKSDNQYMFNRPRPSASADVNKYEEKRGDYERRDSWQNNDIDIDRGRTSDSVHTIVDVEECTRATHGDGRDTTCEETEGQSTTNSNTQGHLPFVPELCPGTTAPARDNCTEPHLDSEPQGARALCSEDDMETASGTATDCDTESDTTSETDGDRAVEEIVNKRLKTVDNCTSHVLSLLKDKQRNQSFTNIVLDRRGNRVPKLVCSSDDTVMTFDTGTGDLDFHIKERQDHYYNIGDDLAKCSKQWPQIDRQGIYKQTIERMNVDLTIAMGIVRNKAAFVESIRDIHQQVKQIQCTLRDNLK